MAYKPIENYGIIGDMNSAALVGIDGSIDWCCFPRFDSPSVFAAILDDEKGGRFQIAPDGPGAELRQAYLPDTNILQTEFITPTGVVTLTDFMPIEDAVGDGACQHEIHRQLRCTAGDVEVQCTFQPGLDYARSNGAISRVKEGVTVQGHRQTVTLCTEAPLAVEGAAVTSRFTLHEGQEMSFVLAYGQRRPHRVASYHTREKLAQTRRYWESVVSRINYDGLWRDEVVRSLLALQLLIYRPTGAVVAAPTTSLPEGIGGTRNWDYRFAWLRDSSLAMDALYRMGLLDEAQRYLKWLLEQCKVTSGRTRIVYGLCPNSSLKESDLSHLSGYRSSAPVRVGNGAARHLQLDVFGEVILGIETLHRSGGGISEDAWSLVRSFAEAVIRNWQRKDRGVWEIRGRQQHFVYSKVMCWTALDRAATLATSLGRDEESSRWHRIADDIKEEVLSRGWSESKQSFVQRYGSDTLDASSLVIPFIGFLPAHDPRVRSTIDAISRELANGPFVRRYLPNQTDDGQHGESEGAFTLLSFWLIGNLIYTGQTEKAHDYFQQVLGSANHLGLFAEMIDPVSREFLGNFPQAYSHIGLIHTARNLSRALTGKPERLGEQVAAAD